MRLTFILSAIALAACTSVPVPERADAAMDVLPTLTPSGTAAIVPGLAIDRWWTLFGDAQLDTLIAQALARNHDLDAAAARVREARARLDEVHASGLPALDLQAQKARARQSGDGALPPGADLHRSRHQVALVAQYDVDLWGRIASSDEAARQRLLAQEWARAAVAWGLTAQLAEAHFSLRAAQRQIEISEAVRTSRADTLALRVQEHKAGLGSEFELRRAEAELAAADAGVVNLRRQRVALQGTIALLSGLPVADVAQADAPRAALDPMQAFQARLPQGETEQWLVHRPDLRQAETQLAAAHADIAAARAAALPALRLSGNLGSDVQSLSNLFNAPGLVWSVAAGLTQSLVDGGANRARVEQAQARRDAAIAQYRKTVLAAVLELREAYAALDLTTRAHEAQRQRVHALERAQRLARAGVEAGALARIDLIDAERNAYQAQLDEVASFRDRLVSQVAVMKALGGGHAGVATSPTL